MGEDQLQSLHSTYINQFLVETRAACKRECSPAMTSDGLSSPMLLRAIFVIEKALIGMAMRDHPVKIVRSCISGWRRASIFRIASRVSYSIIKG